MPGTTGETVRLADRAAAHALDVLGRVTDDELTRPTPLPGWDLATLLAHIGEATTALAGLVTAEEPPSVHRSPERDPHPARLAQARVGHLREVLRVGEGADAAVRQAAHGASIELTAHAWDVQMARRHEALIPTALADDVYALATTLIADDTRSPHFGPRVDAPAGAASGYRLMGFLGRDLSWPGSR